MRAPLPDDQTGESEVADDDEVVTEVLVEATEDWAEADRVCGRELPRPKQVVSIAED